MDINDLLIGHSVQVLSISLFGQTVVTLWGYELINNQDVLFAKDDNLLLFKDIRDMSVFLKSDESCNFSEADQFVELRRKLPVNLWDYDIEYCYHDYHKIGKLLQVFQVGNWSSEDIEHIVHGLNTLQDAICTINDRKAKSYFFQKANKGRPSHLQILLEELTLYNIDFKDHIILPKRFKPDIAYSQFAETLGRICLRAEIYDKG